MIGIKTITKENFEEEVLKEEKPVILDFHAEWCGSCKSVSRILLELSKNYENVKFCEIDVGKNNEFIQKYGISSLPTILFIKNGVEIARKSGSLTKPEFDNMIKKLLD